MKTLKKILFIKKRVITSEAAKKINIAISKKEYCCRYNGSTFIRACYSKYKTIKNFNEDIDLFIYPI